MLCMADSKDLAVGIKSDRITEFLRKKVDIQLMATCRHHS